MLNRQRGVIISCFTLFVVVAYSYARGVPEPVINSTLESEASIQFNDPAHVVFFNYQTYLTRAGKKGETLARWNLLSAPERGRKIADGEASLKNLYAELRTKQALAREELDLYEAVWGKTDFVAHANTGDTPDTIVNQKSSAHTEQFSALSDRVERFRGRGNWSSMFDGANNFPGIIEPVSISAADSATAKTSVLSPGQRKTPSYTPHQMVLLENLREDKFSATDDPERRHDRSSFPIAVGAILLVGGYFGGKMLFAKRKTNDRESDHSVHYNSEFFKVGAKNVLPTISVHGFGLNSGKIGKAIENASASIKSEPMRGCHDCSGGCVGGCQGCCAIGCDTHCTSCSGTCRQNCVGCSGCSNACGGGCTNVCTSCTGCSLTCCGTIDG